MVEKWLFFVNVNGNPWGYPVVTSMNRAVEKGLMIPLDDDSDKLISHISHKLDLFPWIIRRINDELKQLYEIVRDRNKSHDYTLEKGGYAFPIDDELKYHLVIDIDSLLFELNSCCELVSKLLLAIYNSAGIPIGMKEIGKKITTIIEEGGGNPKWFIELDRHRNIFLHEAAARIAVQIVDDETNKYELLIYQENIHDFNNEDLFIGFSTLVDIVAGFNETMKLIQKHIDKIVS